MVGIVRTAPRGPWRSRGALTSTVDVALVARCAFPCSARIGFRHDLGPHSRTSGTFAFAVLPGGTYWGGSCIRGATALGDRRRVPARTVPVRTEAGT